MKHSYDYSKDFFPPAIIVYCHLVVWQTYATNAKVLEWEKISSS